MTSQTYSIYTLGQETTGGNDQRHIWTESTGSQTRDKEIRLNSLKNVTGNKLNTTQRQIKLVKIIYIKEKWELIYIPVWNNHMSKGDQ